MPGFLTDVVLPPGNPAMDVFWKKVAIRLEKGRRWQAGVQAFPK